MPIYPDLNLEVASADSTEMTDYVSVSEALKLVTPFKGERREVLAFIANVDTAFEVINPRNVGTLFKFVLTRISGEPRTAIGHRCLENWGDLKEFLKNTYTEKRTLDYHANLLFSTKQSRAETVSEWIQRVQKLGSNFREAALQDCEPEERAGILTLADKLRNICFVQGLWLDRIQTIVRSRNYVNFDDIAETALEEESAIVSKNERYKNTGSGNEGPKCSNCNKVGHMASKCYSKEKRDPRVNQITARSVCRERPREITCYNCQGKGHMARQCKKPKKRFERQERSEQGVSQLGNAVRIPDGSGRRTVGSYTVGRISKQAHEFLSIQIDVSKEELLFLVDTGADISLLKAEKLVGSTGVDPLRKERVKGVNGAPIETYGIVTASVKLRNSSIPHEFHLVNGQVDIPCDGILGRDFLQLANAKICYESRTVVLRGESHKMVGRKEPVEAKCVPERNRCKITLPPRAESVIRVPVTPESPSVGMIAKCEIQEGVFMAATLTKVVDGYAMTSVLNLNETETDIPEPMIRLEEVDLVGESDRIPAVKPQDRERNILMKLRLDHLNSEERKALVETCSDYQDIFYLPGDVLSSTGAIKHSIRVEPGTEPINTRPYRLPEAQKAEVENQVKELLREGIIEESVSSWNSPIMVIPKKMDASGKQKFRLVVDYRKLNEKTVGDAYPLPDITEILDQLGQAKYFSCLDLAMGYHQIDMDPDDIDKTAFSTKGGHWAYRRLPFGLKTAPATFQRMMNSVLSGLTGTRCFAFLDDIVLYANSLAEHDTKLREVFGRLRKYNLKLQPDKCEFLRKEVIFLGHKVSERGVEPDARKVEAIKNFPTPTTPKQLKSFLGLAGYYRRFVPQFSRIAAPLHALLKRDVKYVWGEPQEIAFTTLKYRLMSEPVLQYPDFSKEFILTTDASNEGAGAILSQGELGSDLPVAFASRSFNKAERNYSTIEKELAAVVWGVKHFRPYLYGRRFKIVSDHRPLKWIVSVKDPGSRLMRWRIQLEEYDYEIVYKPGVQNANADALSRIGALVKEGSESGEIDPQLKLEILKENHDSVLGGHRGMNKTYEAIKNRYKWPNMKQEVEEYVKRCAKCQMNKQLRPKSKAPMEITSTADHPFERCALDVVGPLTETDSGNKYILTFQDDLSKFLIAMPIPQQDAETVARKFVLEVVLKFGAPMQVLTDQGSNFLSELFKNTCKLLKIRKIQTTAFHPESNGGLERSHRVLAEYLRHYVSEDQTNWDVWLPYGVYVYNTTVHSATNFTPFELVYGFRSEVPSALRERPSVSYCYDDYLMELKGRLQSAHEVARQRLITAKERSKEHYDRGAEACDFQVGQKILLRDETVRRGRSRKLSPQYVGPYEVVAVEGVNVTIKKGRRTQKVHVNRVRAFY